MLNISGYLGAFDEEIIDSQNRIAVNSCGHYKLETLEQFETWRPFGRQDYQLLYLADGCGEFYFEDKKTIVHSESFVLYHPGERQHYCYHSTEKPDVYWVHFSGTGIDAILKEYQINESSIFKVTAMKECTLLFDRMIRELQLKRQHFEILARLYLEEILLLLSRTASAPAAEKNKNRIVEQAIIDFHKEYRSPIVIADYAVSHNISCCWFIRIFKQHTGLTPAQYLTRLRINKAMELFQDGAFNISETAAFVGYDNPLYFSRVFHQNTGCSPSEYIRSLR